MFNRFIDISRGILFKKQLIVPSFGVILMILFVVPASHKPIEAKNNLTKEESKVVTLLFTGDIMQHMPQVEAAWDAERGQYNYDTCFNYVKSLLSGVDIAVANLETTLDGKPYSGYPAFSSPDAIVNSLLWAGIDLVGTANNHCCDRGKSGLIRTIHVLDSLGLPHMGTYVSDAEYQKRNPILMRKNGMKLAFLNYTYGTNGIPVPANTIVSLIEKQRIANDLQAAKDSVPDQIIVYIHWGEEYQRMPNAYQKEIADYLFSQGADIIVGSHPHVIQPMEWHKADSLTKDRIVVWSLGNYVSNQRKQYTDGGAMFELTLEKKAGKTKVTNAGYRLSWVYNPVIQGKRRYYILPAAQFEFDTILLEKSAQDGFKQFISDSRKLLNTNNMNVFELK